MGKFFFQCCNNRFNNFYIFCGSNGNCVEVAFAELSVAVRDSKSPNQGTLVLPASGWSGFLHVAKM